MASDENPCWEEIKTSLSLGVTFLQKSIEVCRHWFLPFPYPVLQPRLLCCHAGYYMYNYILYVLQYHGLIPPSSSIRWTVVLMLCDAIV